MPLKTQFGINNKTLAQPVIMVKMVNNNNPIKTTETTGNNKRFANIANNENLENA